MLNLGTLLGNEENKDDKEAAMGAIREGMERIYAAAAFAERNCLQEARDLDAERVHPQGKRFAETEKSKRPDNRPRLRA